MTSLRDLLAAALLVLAVCVGALCLPGDWVQRNVVEEEGFLAITQPLGEDRDLQRSLTDRAVEDLLDQRWIPAVVADEVAPYAQDTAASATGTGAYQQMWDQVMVDLHAQLFTPGSSALSVDFSPAIDGILEAIEEHLPAGARVPRPESASVAMGNVPDVPALRQAAQLTPWTQWAWLPAVVAAVGAVAIAAHRRVALIGAGVATLVVGASSLLLGLGIGVLVPDSLDERGDAAPVVQAFEAQLTTDLVPRAGIVLGVGALVVTIGFMVLRLTRPR